MWSDFLWGHPKSRWPGHSLEVDEAPGATLTRYPMTRGAIPRASGARDAEFAAVYEAHFDFVWRTIAGLCVGSTVSVEDAAQDVWLTVARRLHEFRGDSSHRTWLFAVARNVVRNHRRGAVRKGGLEPLGDASPYLAREDTEEALAAQAEWQDVQLFLATLDDALRETFLCRFLLEMTPREVATVTGRGVVSVYADTRQLKALFRRWHESRMEESP